MKPKQLIKPLIKKQIVVIIVLLLIGMDQVNCQKKVITGEITSCVNGEPLPGASVVLHRTTIGIESDANGIFSLCVPYEACKLVVSFIGMKTINVDIENPDVQHFDIILEPNLVGMGEFVIAYDTITGLNSRYSITSKHDTIHYLGQH